MARTSNAARAQSIEKQALAQDNKSEGMRQLLTAGKTVAEVRDLFGVPYGYVYGVAKRAGLVEGAANRRPTKAATPPARATRNAKAATPAKPAPRTARATKSAPAPVKRGRPAKAKA